MTKIINSNLWTNTNYSAFLICFKYALDKLDANLVLLVVNKDMYRE
jgi:hypothetical protein